MRLVSRLGLTALLLGLTMVLAPIAAAPAWKPSGWYTLNGSTVFDFGGGKNVTCNPTSFAGSLNAGLTNPGAVNPAFNPCNTNYASCTVTVTVPEAEAPWSILGTNTLGGSGPVTVGSVNPDEMHFIVTFTNVAGQICDQQPNNCTAEVKGAVGGNYAAGTGILSFTNAGGISIATENCGNLTTGTKLTVSGSLSVVGASDPELQ